MLNLLMLALLSAQGDYIRVSKVVRVYDGDTIFVDIPLWPPIVGKSMPIRVRGVDTPEIRGKCASEKALALKAKRFVTSALSQAKEVRLYGISRGKYFRIVADVWYDGVVLSTELIRRGLGRKYMGKGRRGSWCSGI